MSLNIWEGNKAQELINAVNSTRNDVGITQNFADALLDVFGSVGFTDTNGPVALARLRDVINAMLSDSFVSMTEYYVLNGYGPSDSPNGYYGAVARNDRTLLVSELQNLKIPAKSSTSATTYDTELDYSFIKIPAGATQIKQINTAGVAFNLRPMLYDGAHFVLEGVTPPSAGYNYFGAGNNVYKDISEWNDGQYYLQCFYGGTVASGTLAAVIFR